MAALYQPLAQVPAALVPMDPVNVSPSRRCPVGHPPGTSCSLCSFILTNLSYIITSLGISFHYLSIIPSPNTIKSSHTNTASLLLGPILIFSIIFFYQKK